MESPSARYRNFDAIRLIAAATVIFSHSFAMADANEDAEPFRRLLGEGNIAGIYAVYTFFVISGFLITRSFLRRRSLVDYLTKRCLRIFPGLIACVLVVVFVMAPLVTTLPATAFFTDAYVYKYALKTMLLFNTGGMSLPGVAFDENNWYAVQPLGTVWTLRPEFLCYLAVAALGLMRILRPPVLLAALLIGLWRHDAGTTPFEFLFGYFAAGALLYFVYERGRPGRGVMAIAATGLVGGAAAGYPAEAMAIAGSLLVIHVATSSTVRLPRAARYGDLSYGMYLYGWPIGELVNGALDDGSSWWAVFALTLPLAAAAAYASWHLVERRALAVAPSLALWIERRVLRGKPEPAPSEPAPSPARP